MPALKSGIFLLGLEISGFTLQTTPWALPIQTQQSNLKIRRKYLKQITGYTHAQHVHVKVAPLPAGADLPHTCYHCLKFEHFPACLVSEAGLHRAPAGEKPALSFSEKIPWLWNLLLWQETKGSPFESFHYKMWGRAPWTGTSLLINQCKDCGNPGRSLHSAWLTPGGFDLEMEKIWILLIPPAVRWTQNNQAFFKVYLKMLHTNYAHT